jgi:hypothetical protein
LPAVNTSQAKTNTAEHHDTLLGHSTNILPTLQSIKKLQAKVRIVRIRQAVPGKSEGDKEDDSKWKAERRKS